MFVCTFSQFLLFFFVFFSFRQYSISPLISCAFLVVTKRSCNRFQGLENKECRKLTIRTDYSFLGEVFIKLQVSPMFVYCEKRMCLFLTMEPESQFHQIVTSVCAELNLSGKCFIRVHHRVHLNE